ncbi:hypothetical protein CK203_116039 [Vitis vinifera]|uniref:Uncharacterized protein n=1 Tax=Vitis vinifera TaxID=29760 RepID=A0A438CQ25_VITVI|nr:hypothetical protein CK203_116039 [Vitis vinifera]
MQSVPYASVVGSLMYAILCTRPDICFKVGKVSRYQFNLEGDMMVEKIPSMENWHDALRTGRRMLRQALKRRASYGECTSVYGYTLGKTYELDYEGANILMGLIGPHSKLIYLVGMGYEGRIAFVHKGVLAEPIEVLANRLNCWGTDRSVALVRSRFDRGVSKHSLSSSSFFFPIEVHHSLSWSGRPSIEATVTCQSIKCFNG